MIYFYHLGHKKTWYGPRIDIQKLFAWPELLLPHIYFSLCWGHIRWTIAWNPLKRIKKGKIYEYKGRRYNFKEMKYES